MVSGSRAGARSRDRHPRAEATWRRASWVADLVRPGGRSRVRFTCNVCGQRVSAAARRMQREVPSCVRCGSTIRVRALVEAFGREVLGTSLPGPRFPRRPELFGVGISDQASYAVHFARSTTYLNTWYHQEPFRDLMDVTTFGDATYDYVVCSEVLEHVGQPADTALRTIFEVLAPGGVVILTTPTVEGVTVEHHPPLEGYDVELVPGGWRLRGRLADGSPYESDSVIFHGGPGSTVEMRVWGSESLRAAFSAAGFVDIRRHLAPTPSLGILWEEIPETMEVPGGVARGLRSGVWTARRPDDGAA